MAKANHPNSNDGVTTPGADLLDPKETVSELVDAGFPLDAVGLVNSMFIESDNASRTPKEGLPLRGEIDDNVPGGGDSRGKRRDGLGTGSDKVPGAGADRGDPSGKAGSPSEARFGGESFGKEGIPALVGRGPTPWVVPRVLLHKSKRMGSRRGGRSKCVGDRLVVSGACPPP